MIHLYLSVANTTEGTREPHERQLAIDLSGQWAPALKPGAVEAAVDTAYAAARAGLGPSVEEVAASLYRDLSPAACRQLLRDLGLIARADGHLDRHKARVIARVRAAIGSATGMFRGDSS